MRTLVVSFLSIFTFNLQAQSAIEVGQEAPPISITNWVENEPLDKDLTDKFIVLEFWATWCGPCLAAVPHMNEIQKEFDGDDLYFLSITDESVDKIERTLKRIDFHSIVVTDQSKQTQKLFGDGEEGLDQYPLTVLIDNSGIIRWIGSPKELDGQIMDRFLQRESINSISSASESNTSIKEEAETSGITLDDLLTNDMDFYFKLRPAQSNKNSSLIAESILLIGMKGYTLEELYSEVFDIQNIVIPESLESIKFDLLYKNTSPQNRLELLEEHLLNELKLSKAKEKRSQQLYSVSVDDKSKLEKTLQNGFSSTSMADGKLIFTAVTIEEMLQEITKIHEIPFVIKKYPKGDYDFIIEIGSLEKTIKSFESYGLKANLEESVLDVVVLSE